jgi:uncharacterized protein (DUF362 family)
MEISGPAGNRVGIERLGAAAMAAYAACRPPFPPPRAYPELRGVPAAGAGEPGNPAFDALRDLLWRMGCDAARYGTPAWNPLGWLVRPGDLVLIKPNLVVSAHPQGDILVRHTDTDGPLLRALAEYVLLALDGSGTLVFGDSPIKETSFERAAALVGLDRVAGELRRRQEDGGGGVAVELVDFRDFVSRRLDSAPVAGERRTGDPRGYAEFDLGTRSALEPVSHLAGRFRSTAAFYEDRMPETHAPGRHRYGVAGTVLAADVFLNVPKLKTHCKSGLTAALKNLVGICNEKRWLPHHRVGSPRDGGDLHADGVPRLVRLAEQVKDLVTRHRAGRAVYPAVAGVNRAARRLLGVDVLGRIRGSDPYQNGGWHGNDTVWRMVHDLNRILLYGDAAGHLPAPGAPGRRSARRVFTVVDGLWAGEGEGPLRPDGKAAGVLLAGADPLLVDVAAATAMGFDHRRIPLLREAFAASGPGSDLPLSPYGVDDLELVSNHEGWEDLAGLGARSLRFRPPAGWAGFIELPAEPEVPARGPVRREGSPPAPARSPARR